MLKIKNIAQWLRGLMGPMGLIGPMGLMRPIRLMRLMGLIGLMGLLGACSGDEEELEVVPEEAVEIPVEVQGFVARYTETAPLTRGWTPPTGFELYPVGDEVIGIYFTKNTKTPKQGYFFKGSDGWRTTITIDGDEIATPFYLYGYVPHTAGISCSITDYDGGATDEDKNARYDKGAILALENVPTIMAQDLCVVVGAKNGKDDYAAPPAEYSVTDLLPGSFSYQAAAIKKASGSEPATGSGNYVYLLFDHLYAALNLEIKVNDTYDELRTIKLKKLQLEPLDGEDHATTKHADITVKLAANTSGDNPITEVSYTSPVGDEDANDAIFKSDAGKTLTTSYQTFMSHFMPLGVVKLTLTSTYDVYDKKGNLVRKDCTATNVIDFSKLISRFEEVQAGKKYNVKMIVNPTYLYVLSEPDLNNPTVKIVN